MTTAVSPAAPQAPTAPTLDGLPLTVGLEAREVLLVGAGPVSARRAATFLEAGALVRVVAPRVDPAMADLAERAGGDLVVVTRPFTPADLDSPWMVHVATGDPRVDAEVAALCEQRRIWCVTAGDSALGSARVPARTAVATPAGTVRI
ncbi:precorrin-2 dehydrogenase, partial [Dietzia cinnamea P4]